MWDLVPWPGIERRPPAWRAWSLSHWTTREVPVYINLYQSKIYIQKSAHIINVQLNEFSQITHIHENNAQFKKKNITSLPEDLLCFMERQGSLVQCLHFTEVKIKAQQGKWLSQSKALLQLYNLGGAMPLTQNPFLWAAGKSTYGAEHMGYLMPSA